MQTITPVEIAKSAVEIKYSKSLMFAGSCFAENISAFFANAKFRCLANPSGIVYNPLSLSKMFKRLQNGQKYEDRDFFFRGGLYCCYDLHGSFSRPILSDAVSHANQSMSTARKFLETCDVLFITLGTAFVYFLASDYNSVSNCHKMPPGTFTRRLVSVDELASSLQDIVEIVRSINKNTRIVLTVSPIRHTKDGPHGNRLSKSSLFLAADSIVRANSCCEYFPSYEILEDELRDYRYYAEDMCHPSPLAEKIIWERIRQAYFSPDTNNKVSRVEKFMQSAHHIIQNPETAEAQDFCRKCIQAADRLESEIKGLDLSEEKKYYKNFIKFC